MNSTPGGSDRQVLAAVDVDDSLAANAPGPRVATSDGGVVEADSADADTDDSDDGRPDDCDCGEPHGYIDLPCYRDGFETPAERSDD